MLASQPEQADGSRRPLWVFEVDQHPALRNKLAALMFVAFTAVLPSTLQESQNRKAATNPECAGENDCAKDPNDPDFVFAYHNRLPGPMVKAPAYDDVRLTETQQEIPGSSPGVVDLFQLFHPASGPIVIMRDSSRPGTSNVPLMNSWPSMVV
ncbi:hypothetical protein PCASD_24898 [Puccinia coronata f. sp. avenae]|uniref:Uncharacterized protein n=2 Tax=Puccinia coronata f. sp. avenae TaxID=200324 RepID=A0A2N5S6M6_9BASI|nr:hypothetical protein PCASD_24898 [Puccinia coronata f. sp. avenae]